MNNPEKPRWYIFYCRSRSEKKVFDLLQKSNYMAFLPIVEVVRQWSDRTKKVKVPILPGYIFVYCLHSEIFNVVKTDNIVASVKIAGDNLYLREHELDLLKKIEQHNLFESVSPNQLSKGDKVLVMNGPLKGFEGEYIREDGKHFLQIQIETVGQYIMVKIHADNLQKK